MPRFTPYSTLDVLCDLGQTLSPVLPHLSPSPYEPLGRSPASTFHDPFHDSGLGMMAMGTPHESYGWYPQGHACIVILLELPLLSDVIC